MKSMILNHYCGKRMAVVRKGEATKLSIDYVCWPERYDERPEVVAELKHDGEALWISYQVCGQDLRGEVAEDFGKICTDSCCEFFCRPAGAIDYQNYEINCIGYLTASERRARKVNVRYRSPEQMARIERFAPLGRQPIGERPGLQQWEVGLRIPFDLLFPDGIEPIELDGKNVLLLEANFYKCADKAPHPHYLSWNPIRLPAPNFHCPEFFGLLIIELKTKTTLSNTCL